MMFGIFTYIRGWRLEMFFSDIDYAEEEYERLVAQNIPVVLAWSDSNLIPHRSAWIRSWAIHRHW